ncbi:MAG TPA: aminomethyltransferase family protein, partial [Anaerolineae bacterium]|nr:aminomethyltransferase family protein [Anaerolineae bacterium]
LTAADVSNQDFPYFTARPLKIGSVPAYALRLSYVGELGWEIYCPVEYGLHLWDLLWNAGQAHGLIAFGGAAFNTLRLEKGYRLWGADIHTEYHPYEAGLGWAVRLQKGDFLGRDALAHLKTQTLRRQLCCLTLDEPQAVALGKEPIMSNGQTLGYVTSAGYGYSVGKFILYGYLPLEHAAPGSRVEVAYFDRRYGATVTAEPLFDPRQSRVKA